MKFILCADSWANAYYQQNLLFKSKTFEQYYRTDVGPDSTGFRFYKFVLESLGHTVVDLSFPGASNLVNIARLNSPDMDQHNDADFVLWIHTHPTRDIVDYNTGEEGGISFMGSDIENTTKLLEEINTVEELNLLMEKYSLKTMNSLNELSNTKFKNTHFLCLGGVGRLEKKLFPDNDKIHLLIPSIYELMLDMKLETNLLFASWHKIAEYFNKEQLIDEILKYVQHDEEVYGYAILRGPAWPDNSMHPNAGSILKVLDCVFNYIETNKTIRLNP